MEKPETELLVEHGDGLNTERDSTPRMVTEASAIVPVFREQIEVRKNLFTTGTVRIQKVVHERDELFEEPIIHSKVEVERISINRFVDVAPPVRQEGETTIYSVVEEVLVVTKQLVLKEEVRITNRISEIPQRQSITLRTEELVIDREQVIRSSEV